MSDRTNEVTDFPKRKYQIIYADPPWSYRDKATQRGGAILHYPTMTEDQIKTLPVRDLADDDCILFLWVTMPKLNEAFDLIKAWGFTYKTNGFTWVKTNKISNSLFWGMGRWTRANAELCLIATKGSPKRVDMGVHSVIQSRIRSHSEKPTETRERIVRLMGDVPRIELFARHEVEGWDSWGNEVNQ